MDKIGPIARSAEDCLLVLDAIQGADQLDRAAVDAPLAYQSADKYQRTLRIGYTPADFQRRYPFRAQDSLVLAQLVWTAAMVGVLDGVRSITAPAPRRRAS